MPGGFDDPSDHPLVGQDREPYAQTFGRSLIDEYGLEQRSAVIVDHSGSHSPVLESVFDVEELFEPHPLQVSLPVTVEQAIQDGILTPETSGFILCADEEKISVPGIVKTLERAIDGIFHGGSDFQHDFSQQSRFGKPPCAVGEDKQSDDQQGDCHRDGAVFLGEYHASLYLTNSSKVVKAFLRSRHTWNVTSFKTSS
jgi:hypothetical protein